MVLRRAASCFWPPLIISRARLRTSSCPVHTPLSCPMKKHLPNPYTSVLPNDEAPAQSRHLLSCPLHNTSPYPSLLLTAYRPQSPPIS